MPDATEPLDIAAALRALALVLDDDAPLCGMARVGVSVLLAMLASRLEAHAGAVWDREAA